MGFVSRDIMMILLVPERLPSSSVLLHLGQSLIKLLQIRLGFIPRRGLRIDYPQLILLLS